MAGLCLPACPSSSQESWAGSQPLYLSGLVLGLVHCSQWFLACRHVLAFPGFLLLHCLSWPPMSSIGIPGSSAHPFRSPWHSSHILCLVLIAALCHCSPGASNCGHVLLTSQHSESSGWVLVNSYCSIPHWHPASLADPWSPWWFYQNLLLLLPLPPPPPFAVLYPGTLFPEYDSMSPWSVPLHKRESGFIKFFTLCIVQTIIIV